MYIAINMKVAKCDITQALRWSLRAETIEDMIRELKQEEKRTGQDFNEYIIFTV